MPPPKETPFSKSLGSITWIAAAIVTFATLPPGYFRTVDWVTGLALAYSRDDGFLGFVSLSWMALCGVLIFSVSRAILSALLSSLGLIVVLYFTRHKD